VNDAPLANPRPRSPPRESRATEIRRVSSPFGNTLCDCESIVRSHPRSGLTWSYCDETSTVPSKEAGGLRRLPFWLWGLGVTPPIRGQSFVPFDGQERKAVAILMTSFSVRGRKRAKRGAASRKSKDAGSREDEGKRTLKKARLHNSR